MSLDIFHILKIVCYIIVLGIFFWVVEAQKKLFDSKKFIQFFALSILSFLIGAVYDYNVVQDLENIPSRLLYTASIPVLFVISYTILGGIWKVFFNRYPDFEKYPENKVDIIFTLLLLPFVLIPQFYLIKLLNTFFE